MKNVHKNKPRCYCFLSFLALIFVLLFRPGTGNVLEVHAKDDGSITFKVNDLCFYGDSKTDELVSGTGFDGGVEVIQYDGTDLEVTVPDSVSYDGKTYQVVRIGDDAFNYSGGGGTYVNISGVQIPDSIREIGSSAFSGCNLDSVNLPEGLKLIDEYAFSGCGLDSIEIPASLGDIERYAFQNNDLHSIYFPKGRLYIGEGAFQGCPLGIVQSELKNADDYTLYSIDVGAKAFGFDENGVKYQTPPTFYAGSNTGLASYAEYYTMPIEYYHDVQLYYPDQEGGFSENGLAFGSVEEILNAQAALDMRKEVWILNKGKSGFVVNWTVEPAPGSAGMFTFTTEYPPDSDGVIKPGECMKIIITPPHKVTGVFYEDLHITTRAVVTRPYYQGEDLGRIPVSITIGEHQHVFEGEWLTDVTYHYKKCQVPGCYENGMFAEHDRNIVVGALQPTFDADGYTGEKYCSVCGKHMESGKPIAAGKYIRESRVKMNPDVLLPGMTCNDISITSEDPSKYTAMITSSYDLTLMKPITLDTPFIYDHQYQIIFRFEAKVPYEYDEFTAYRGSLFYVNGAETDMAPFTSLGYSVNRMIKRTVADPEYVITENSVTGIEDMPYTGNKVFQDPVVKVQSKNLTEGTDYSLTYKNNKNAGVATVIINGKGMYQGTVEKDFKILFKDVPATHNYQKAVYWAAKNGIAAGYTGSKAGYFGINDNVTRGQVMVFLWRAAGKPEPAGTGKDFKDVPAGSSFYSAIKWGVEQGITGGYTGARAGEFGPNDNCTRGQIMTFLYRFSGKPEPEKNTQTFDDVPTTHSFYKAIQWASEKGITSGYSDGTFGVNKPCTRGHCVTFLYRMLK